MTAYLFNILLICVLSISLIFLLVFLLLISFKFKKHLKKFRAYYENYYTSSFKNKLTSELMESLYSNEELVLSEIPAEHIFAYRALDYYFNIYGQLLKEYHDLISFKSKEIEYDKKINFLNEKISILEKINLNLLKEIKNV